MAKGHYSRIPPWSSGVDGSQGERPDAVIANRLHGLVDTLVGFVGHLDLNDIVETRRLRPIDRGGQLVGEHRINVDRPVWRHQYRSC
jgi:hypothetical protein